MIYLVVLVAIIGTWCVAAAAALPRQRRPNYDKIERLEIELQIGPAWDEYVARQRHHTLRQARVGQYNRRHLNPTEADALLKAIKSRYGYNSHFHLTGVE